MARRTLALKRETLSDLSPADLQSVNGAAPPTVRDCVKTLNGCALPTFEYSCFNCISHPPCTI